MQFPVSCNIKLKVRSFSFKLSVFWILGLLLGTLFAAGLDFSAFSLMRRIFSFQVSIVVHLIFAVLPFLICTYAFMIHRQEIVFAVLFCKAFTFSFLAFSVCWIFGTAGWLIQPMLFMPDILLMPLLFWFGMQKGKALMRDHIICLGAAVLSVLIHYCVVLPFVAELID